MRNNNIISFLFFCFLRVTDRSLAGSQNGFTVLKNTSKDADKTEENVEFSRGEGIPYFCKEIEIAEQLDNCVTSAGVIYFCFHSTYTLSQLYG